MRKAVLGLWVLTATIAASPIQAGVAVVEVSVDGSDYLLIRGADVRVEHRNFEPLTNLKVRFDDDRPARCGRRPSRCPGWKDGAGDRRGTAVGGGTTTR